MMPVKYILNDKGEPVPEPDIDRWLRFYRDEKLRRLALDMIGDARVSTVFLAVNHALTGPPVLWETMIFGGLLNKYTERYTSREDALAGHARAVFMLREQAPSEPT